MDLNELDIKLGNIQWEFRRLTSRIVINLDELNKKIEDLQWEFGQIANRIKELENGIEEPDVLQYLAVPSVSCGVERTLCDSMEAKAQKSRIDLIPGEALLAAGRVLAFGAKKHGESSWKEYAPDIYLAAAMRHLAALQKGELEDPETGESHWAHVLCNAAFGYYLSQAKKEMR